MQASLAYRVTGRPCLQPLSAAAGALLDRARTLQVRAAKERCSSRSGRVSSCSRPRPPGLHTLAGTVPSGMTMQQRVMAALVLLALAAAFPPAAAQPE